MPVTEQRMKPGSFQVALRPDTPLGVTTQLGVSLQGFGHVVILPAHFPADAVSAAELLGLALYTGVFRRRTGRNVLEGAGPAVWLGDEQGKGRNPAVAITKPAGTFVQWITDLKPPGSLTAGIYHPQSGTLDWSTVDESRRDSVDYVCARFGCEWRINPDLTLDAGTADELYGADPVVIFTPWWDGRELGVAGMRATLKPVRDVEDYTTEVLLRGAAASVVVSVPSTAFKDIVGNDVVIRRVVDSPDTLAGEETAVAQSQLDRVNFPRRRVTATTDQYAPTLDAPVGAHVWLWDPVEGIFDASGTDEVYYRGELLWPDRSRVVSCTWPIREGMGVYFRQVDGTVLDLTEWVEWESGAARYELDSSKLPVEAVREPAIRVA